jgi:glycosyltransferase involved in cell wall biosynthesis
MASGLPCIATSVGGVPEVVADGVTGLLVPPRQPACLAEAILRVYRDATFAVHLRAAGRRRVEEQFDVRRMVQRYEQWYLQTQTRKSAKQTLRKEVQACGSHT